MTGGTAGGHATALVDESLGGYAADNLRFMNTTDRLSTE